MNIHKYMNIHKCMNIHNCSKFWVREPVIPRHLNSYEQIRTMLINGNPLRFAITLDGCQCVDGNCGHGFIGGNIAGKIFSLAFKS